MAQGTDHKARRGALQSARLQLTVPGAGCAGLACATPGDCEEAVGPASPEAHRRRGGARPQASPRGEEPATGPTTHSPGETVRQGIQEGQEGFQEW